LRQFPCANEKFNLYSKHKKALGLTFVQKSRALNVGEIVPWWPSLFAVLLFAIFAIFVEIQWNLTPYLCNEPALEIIRGFAIRTHYMLERNPHDERGKSTFFF
jgi:hypothetical protein